MGKPQGSVAAQEPCHKLAWTLDACLKDMVLDERRLRELSLFFSGFEGPAGQHRGKPSKRPRDWEGPSEFEPGSSSHLDEPQRVLAEAGMVLRDPSSMHLIVHQVALLASCAVNVRE